jgi:predicted aspartyl protease
MSTEKMDTTDKDRYDNMAVYYSNRSAIVEKWKGKYFAVAQGEVVGAFESEAAAKEHCHKLNLSNAFITKVGDEQNESRSLVLSDLVTEINGVYHVKFNYDKNENKLVDAASFKPYNFKHGLRYFVCVLVQTKDSMEAGKGVPTTFLIDTGSPRTFIHDRVLTALGVPSYSDEERVYLHGIKVPHVRLTNVVDHRFIGFNLLGLDALKYLGFEIEAEDGSILYRFEKFAVPIKTGLLQRCMYGDITSKL